MDANFFFKPLTVTVAAMSVAAAITYESTGETWKLRPGDVEGITEADISDLPRTRHWALKEYVVVSVSEAIPWPAPALWVMRAARKSAQWGAETRSRVLAVKNRGTHVSGDGIFRSM